MTNIIETLGQIGGVLFLAVCVVAFVLFLLVDGEAGNE